MRFVKCFYRFIDDLSSYVYFAKSKVYNTYGVNITKLKELRKQRHLTMRQLGAEIGVAESTVSLYENEKRQPDNVTLIRLAKFFNVTVDCLLGNEEGNESTDEGKLDVDINQRKVEMKAAMDEMNDKQIKRLYAIYRALTDEDKQ